MGNLIASGDTLNGFAAVISALATLLVAIAGLVALGRKPAKEKRRKKAKAQRSESVAAQARRQPPNPPPDPPPDDQSWSGPRPQQPPPLPNLPAAAAGSLWYAGQDREPSNAWANETVLGDVARLGEVALPLVPNAPPNKWWATPDTTAPDTAAPSTEASNTGASNTGAPPRAVTSGQGAGHD